MALYDKEDIFKQAIKAIKDNNLFFVDDVVAFVPCGRSRFYDFFPDGSEQLDAIKKGLNDNKVKTKSSIRAKLFEGKGMELIALYKILANDDELNALNGVPKGNSDQIINVTFQSNSDPNDERLQD